MSHTYADTLAALGGEYSPLDAAQDAVVGTNLEVITDMTFMDALYSGKNFIRVPYNQLQGRDGYCTFNTKTDPIGDLCGLHDHEFIKEMWEASDDETFGGDDTVPE